MEDCVLELLKFVYPGVDWSRVVFHRGIPHLIGIVGQDAITLPDPWSPHIVRVFVRDWDPCTCDGLATIVHEGFHVRQIWDTGWDGLFMVRPFTILYLACWAANGFSYEGHPMEVAAYRVAGCPKGGSVTKSCPAPSLFDSCCNPIRRACDCSTSPPSLDETGFANFKAACGNVVQTTSGLEFFSALASCTPGWTALLGEVRLQARRCTSREDETVELPPDEPGREPPIERAPKQRVRLSCVIAVLLVILAALYYLLWLLVWTAITLIAWLLKLVVDLIGLVVAGVMWVITGIVCAVEWLIDRVADGVRAALAAAKQALDAACKWSNELEQTCTEWEEKQEQKCTKEEDQGYQKCTQEEDRGYQKCAQEEERGHNECCTWWPCSWACNAWVWVSNIVCVAWTWVSNKVCVTWTWVSNKVCVAWTWIVSKTCKAFTWTVKKATCW